MHSHQRQKKQPDAGSAPSFWWENAQDNSPTRALAGALLQQLHLSKVLKPYIGHHLGCVKDWEGETRVYQGYELKINPQTPSSWKSVSRKYRTEFRD